jgi:FAD:protein FMN transferase
MLGRIVLLALIALNVSCQNHNHQRFESYVFGTLVTLDIYDTPKDKAEVAATAVETEFQRIHHAWHAWKPGGIVADINQAIASGKAIQLSPEIRDFIQKCQTYARQSQQYFNPAIGYIISAWSFHSEDWHGPPPTTDVLQRYTAPLVTLDAVSIDDVGMLRSNDSRVKLDFGAIGKGYALEVAAQILQKQGIHTALVSAGGDVKALGARRQSGWKIGMVGAGNALVGEVSVRANESVVSSGTYERKFTWQGKTYHHVINPHTGAPSVGVTMVTVIYPNAIRADAAATALLANGGANWLEIAQAMGVEYVFMLDDKGKVIMTEPMRQRVRYYSAENHDARTDQ